MGENILESQAKNTKKRRTRIAADRQQKELFERGDQVCEEFTVDKSTGGPAVKIGDVLLCLTGKGNAPVDVIYENKKIGIVDDGGGDVLREITLSIGCQPVVVCGICELTDTMKIQLKKD